MKVAILIDRLNVGGVEKIAIEEVRALRKINVDARLVVLSRKAVVKNAFTDLRNNIPIEYLDDRLPAFLRFTFKFPIFSFFSFFHISYPFLLPFIIKKKEFDYIISHGTYTCFTALAIKKIHGIPYAPFIWDPIGYILMKVYIERFPKVFLQPLLALGKLFDGIIISNGEVILVGGDAHNTYLRKLNINKKILTIHPSVQPISVLTKKKQKYVLTVTAWKKGKNPEYVLDLVSNFENINIKIVGKWLDIEYKKEFEKLVKEKHMDKKIDIIGEVTEKELTNYYKNALVVLQINDDRGFGMPALEAAGRGSTFIIPEGQGVCKLFKNGKDGFFTKEKDTKTIIKYLTKFYDSEELSYQMGKHAWETVRERYSWEKHAIQIKKLVNAYEI